jgi:AAA+ superfamily predicted ATPase
MSTTVADISYQGETPHLPTRLDPALERVLIRFRLQAKRRVAWLRKLWGEEGEPGGNFAVTHAEIDTHLEGRDAPEAEAAWIASDESALKWSDELARIEAEMAGDNDSRLARLRQTFSLDDLEFDLFQGCLAVALDPSLARVCAYLQDHAGRAYMTEHLAVRLYGHFGRALWRAQSSLKRWELVTETEAGPGEPHALVCEPQIRDWLLGDNRLDPYLSEISEIVQPMPPLKDWPVDEAARFLEGVLNAGEFGGARIHIVGAHGTGRRTLAAAISSRLGLPLLAINADRIADEQWGRTFVRAQRQAYLECSALAWHGEPSRQQRWSGWVKPFPVQFMIAEREEDAVPVSGFIDHRIIMPVPTLSERRELWRSLVPASASWDEEQVKGLVDRHRLNVGQITAIARRGVNSPKEAVAHAREVGRHRLGKLAQLLESPFSWDDLIVTDHLKEALSDLLFEAQKRPAFWERAEARRLYPQGRGLLALFSGTPGTGKTMAAQVIAASLGLDLFRIDLSTVVSKYVGETSQNLEQILSRAAHMDVVLLFDEADALFGKRTEIRDAHDRFANTDTGYLLQAIENYQGIALLTTNKKGNIDPGFIRRIRYVFEFPKPDAGQRLRIWERVVGELVGEAGHQAVAADLQRLAQSLETTGAQIKFAVLAAIFAAQQDGGRLGVRHLMRGLDHEFAKEGRALSDRERERLQGHG